MLPKNKFRYRIFFPLGNEFVEPLGESDFKIEWNREDENKIQYKKEQPSKIIFQKGTFKKLLFQEQSIYRCEFLKIQVERYCSEGDTWETWFTGRLSNNNGDWDLDRCLLDIKADRINPDQCFVDKKSTEVNLFDQIAARHTVKTYDNAVTIETVTHLRNVGGTSQAVCQTPYFPTDPELGFWANYYHQYRHLTGLNICVSTSKWARQKIVVPCADPSPGADWHLIATACPGVGRTYVKKAVVYDCQDTEIDGLTKLHECKILGISDLNFIDNGMYLKDVLEAFMSLFCNAGTVISDFFQINAENLSLYNYVTGELSKTNRLFVFQKSDVKRPGAFNNATKAIWTFEKCLNTLCEMFNCQYRFLDNGDLRIEHVSFWGANAGLDLTQDKYKKFVLGKRKYGYANEQIPGQEKFTFMEASVNSDFAGVPIFYSGACVTEGKDNVKTHSVDSVTTDVNLCLLNPSGQSNDVSDAGFVIIATRAESAENVIITEDGILSDRQINNSLAWAQLHRDYHRYNRPLINGNMNNVDTVFESAKPTKKGVTITIPLCCNDVFNPDDSVKTALGDGVVDKATYSFKDQTLQLELLYQIEDLVENTPPVAVNDNFPGITNTMGVELDLIEPNDSDAENNIVDLLLLGPALHGSIIVNYPGLTVTYTANPGYTGPDLFTYQLIDAYGQHSNTAIVTLTVV